MRRPRLGRPERDQARRARTALVLCVLTAVTVMTLDAGTGDDSPVDPVRSAAGGVFGPLETGAVDGHRPGRRRHRRAG